MSEFLKYNPEAAKRVDLNRLLGNIDAAPTDLSNAIYTRMVKKLS